MNWKKIIIYIIVLVIIGIIYNLIQISQAYINKVKVTSNKLNNPLKITQITDFHSNKLINLDNLFDEVKMFNPDIIVLTGDLIDFKTTDISLALDLAKRTKDITPKVYFVNGNHEIRSIFSIELANELTKLGIEVLENRSTLLELNSNKLNISGVGFFASKEEYDKTLKDLDFNNYNILLSHSPNRPMIYLTGLEDLILSGHTHGGQVRIPFIGGIIAPGQGFFPKYDKGLMYLGDTKLYIDSGLGNSVYPIRLFNRVQITNMIIEPESN